MSISCCDSFCERTDEIKSTLVFASDERSQKIKSIAIGVLVGLASFLVVTGVIYALQKHVPGFRISQDAVKIFNLFKNIHPVLHIFWRVVWRGFIVLGAPIVEEFLFRGMLLEGIKKCQGERAASIIHKIIRIALVSLIFGVCHLSPFQNTLSNLVIFGMTTVLGVALTLLKEYRKDLLAPVTAHMIYNLGATL